jgi:hypothetical protein
MTPCSANSVRANSRSRSPTREPQFVLRAELIRRLQHDLVRPELARDPPLFANRGADRPRVGVGWRSWSADIADCAGAPRAPLLPELSDRFDRLAVAACHKARRVVLAL